MTQRQDVTQRQEQPERASVVVRPGVFLTLVIASVFAAGLVIFWLLRSMHI